MRDPFEGVDEHGCIVTGVRRDRVPGPFAPILDAAIETVTRHDARGPSLYLYGSVATGMARSPTSDVDLVSIGMDTDVAAVISQQLSSDFARRCRSVEIAVAQLSDLDGEDDRAYGNRAFLRHYCIHLSGPPVHPDLPAFPADQRAARGFNGDIGIRACRWRSELEDGQPAPDLPRRLARKSLLALSGLVSVRDGTWTTDRASAARRWNQIEPEWAPHIARLVEWSESAVGADDHQARTAVDGVVAHIVASFDAVIGLWDADQPPTSGPPPASGPSPFSSPTSEA